MKKITCLLLSIVMVMSVLYPCRIVIAKEIERHNTELFCEAVAEINDTYNSDSQKLEFSEKETDENPNMNYTENRLIVRTKNEINDADAVDCVYGLDYTILQYDDKSTMERAYDELTEKGYTVEKDRVLSVKDNSIKNLRTMDDEEGIDREEVSRTWAYESIMSDYAKAEIEASSAYNNEIVVGVLDSGVDYTHELFDGRITDTTFNMSFSGEENDCMDDNGHGSSVAGIIVLSTPDNVKIKPYKVIDSAGTVTLSEFTAAMEVILASNDLPDIMNVSLGGYLFEENMSIETELIGRLVEKGVTVCVASGNDNLPVEYCTPADYEGAITVGAYDYTNHICSFSNYGKEVDIAAPGYDIYTVDLYTDDTYTYEGDGFTGTSAACPFASAACAYILMQNPKLSPAEVQDKIKSSAISMGEDEKDYYGAGMLNFPNLLNDKEYSIPEPSAKTGLYHGDQIVEFNNIPADTQLVYTLDKSIPSCINGTVYTDPIIIDNEMQLNYALIKDNKYVSNISSQYYTVQYYADENDFEISDDGKITAYNGDKNNIIVPDTINGIVPTTVYSTLDSTDTFKKDNMTSVILPDTVTTLSGYAFYNCKELKYVKALGVTTIGSSFCGCYSLRFLDTPNLKKAGTAAFQDCSMMHEINFEDTLESIGSSTFEYSGLMSAKFPKLTFSSSRIRTFIGCPLISCSIPGITQLSLEFFADCNFLQELYVPNVIVIDSFAFRGCWFLTEVDFPSLTRIYSNAFAYCYIDTLYAPSLTDIRDSTISSSSQGIAYRSYIRVIDLPAITEISGHFLLSMFVEELYLENVKSMDYYSLFNLPDLNVLYMPSIQDFEPPKTLKTYDLNYMGPMEIVWIPNAVTTDTFQDFPNTSKLVYAPSITDIQTNSYDTTFVLSEKATNIWIGCGRYLEGIYPTIIAPKGSAAEEFVNYKNTNETLPTNFKFIDSDSIATAIGGQIRIRDNGLRFGFVLDEKNLGFDLSEYENLYSRINKEYGFVYSFDGIDENSETASMDLRAGNENSYLRTADKRNVDGTISYYNAVFTGIPSSHYDSEISARAYICIDGMYFYSPVITRSFSDVANAILNDNEIDQNTKDEVSALINGEV
ncbi:MAG: S8 family serine peptidase [Eubacterium sp.]